MDRSPVRGVARLAAILDSLPEALLLIDSTGRVVNANAVALGWFEGVGAPLVGRSITEFLSGFGTAVARVGEGGGVWAGGGFQEQTDGAPGGPERMVAKLASGVAFPAEIVRSFLPAAHGGLEVVCVRNVSSVADAEQELRRQQRQTELILRATSEGIVGVDTAGRVVLVNPAAARILKYRASELGGLEFESLLIGESPVGDTLRTGRKHRLGVEAGIILTAKDGTRVPVELSTAPVLENEALVGAVVTFVDVSRFRLPVPAGGADSPAADPADAGRLSAEHLSALRRPLDAARAELARLADAGEGLSPAHRHHLAHITAELAEAARLVDDLQDAVAGRSGLRKRPAELGRIVHAAVDAATDLAAAAGIDLAVHTGPAEVVMDAERLTQALRHLLVDTVQASPHGSTVVVAAARRGPIARIEIRGTQIGSVPEHLDFARGVVERHGGQLSAHRVEGKGVTYVIELPAGTPAEPGALGPAAAPAAVMSRPLVEETRIIPIVRDTDPPAALPAAPARATPPQPSRPAVPQLPASAPVPPPAPATQPAPAIPRQADPADEDWFDGVRGYAAGTVETDVSGPRGRRRAAALNQVGARAADSMDGYLIQQVDPYPADSGWDEDDAEDDVFARARQQLDALEGSTRGLTAVPPTPAPRLPQPPQSPSGQPAGFGNQGTDPVFGDRMGGAGGSGRGSADNPAYGPQPAGAGFGDPNRGGQTNGAAYGPAPAFGRPQGDGQQPADLFREDDRGQAFGPEPAFGRAPAYGPQPADPFRADNRGPADAADYGPQPAFGRAPSNDLSASGGQTAATTGYGPEPTAFAGDSGRHQIGGLRPEPAAGRGADQPATSPDDFGGGFRPQTGPVAPRPFTDQDATAVHGFGPLTGDRPAAQAPAAPPASGDDDLLGRSGLGDSGLNHPFGAGARYGSGPATPVPPPGIPSQPPFGPQPVPAPSVPTLSPAASPSVPSAAPAPAAAGPRAWPNPDEPDPEPAPEPARPGWPAAGAPAGPDVAQPTLLVWPAPEPTSAELLIGQGYAPTALKAPGQLAETGPLRPVALLADPVGVPVTRAALHTLRAAAADSGIPLFVTAGLGVVPAAALAATVRRGADPSALLRALTPEQVPNPRVVLVEENPDLASAFAVSLERDGMRVVQAGNENDAMAALSAEHPQLVVMNMTLVRRRRSGVVDWLRAYERLHLAPTVLYTVPANLTADPELIRALRSGTAAVHLTDRETTIESANRLLDLMGKVAD